MALEKELQEAMAGRSDWRGNPDLLWANVADAISTAESAPRSMSVAVATAVSEPTPVAADAPTPAPLRRSSWRAPAWAAAAVVVLAAAGSWAVWPGAAPQLPPKPTPPVTGPGPSTPKGTIPKPMSGRSTKEPGPPGAGVTITSGKQVFTPGEPVHLTVRFSNESSEAIQLAAAVPELYIRRASSAFGLPASLPLPELAGRRLASGEAVSVDSVWTATAAVPGWYRAELGLVQYEMAGKPGSMGGGGTALFMAYPPGAVKTDTVESGATAALHDITLTVRKVEFTDRGTIVHFHLSQLRAPAEFGLTLKRSVGAPEAPLSVSHKDSPEGGIDGIAQFDPTPAGTTSITVAVPELSVVHVGQGMEKLTGPWRVTVPLN